MGIEVFSERIIARIMDVLLSAVVTNEVRKMLLKAFTIIIYMYTIVI